MPEPRRHGSATIAEASERAIGFLLAGQEQTGRWWDFELPAGASDEWATAFVGTHLADTVEGRSAASHAWEALRRRRGDDDGWGYNRLTPPDADSTAWALRLADRLGGGSDLRAELARRFLNRHALPHGGVTTYVDRVPIRAYTQLPESASLRGWQSAHPCVAAAAAPFLDKDPRDFLRQTLEKDGAAQGYWWWDEEYTRALAVEWLRGSTNPKDIESVSRGCGWAAERIGDDGAVRSPDFGPSAFATAWALYLLAGEASADAREAAQRAVTWLAQNQLDDGSWPASARLRVPMPGDTDPEASKRRLDVLDERRLFTTASVLAALQRFERGEADAGS